jgi:glycosyltransferase involved in cell wall biosynthesis
MSIATVSVVIPVYNRADSVMLSLESALHQTLQDIEIIVVDDASTDNTFEVLQSCTDKRVTLIRHEVNKGGGAARNSGIKLSSGRYIAFLDSDDSWHQDKLQLQVQKLNELDSEWGGVYSGRIDVIGDHRVAVVPQSEGRFVSDVLTGKVSLASGSTLMIRKECIKEVGYFDESLSRFQDLDFVLRVFAFYKIAVIERPLAYIYRYYKVSFKSIERDTLHLIDKIYKYNAMIGMAESDMKRVVAFRYLQLSKNLMQGCGSMGISLKYFYKAIKLNRGISLKDCASMIVIVIYRICGVDLRKLRGFRKEK